MYCNSCGSLIKDGQSFCENCGAPVAQPVQPVQQAQPAPQPEVQQVQPATQPVVQPAQPVYQQPVPQATAAVPAAKPKVSKGFAVTGFIFGVSSVLYCFVPFVNIVSFLEGFIGAIFSIIGLAKKTGKLKPMAVIGLILCIFAMFVSGLMWASLWSDDASKLFDFLFGWFFEYL